jgi:hypothetical protein
MTLNHVFAVAIAGLFLGACGLRPVKPSASEQLDKLDALYGEAVVIYQHGGKESRSFCEKGVFEQDAQKRACKLLSISDEVTVNVTSTFWGGIYKVTILVPSDQQVQTGDIIKFHRRDSVFGFIKVAARADDPQCRWESGLIKGATAQGVVCEDYDYRKVIEILDKYQ